MCIKIYPVVSIKHEFILNPEQKITSDIFFTIIYNLMISSRLRLNTPLMCLNDLICP